jgi:serine/threonine protein kinase
MRYWLMKASIYAANINAQFQGQAWPYAGLHTDDRISHGDVVYLVQGGGGLYGWGFITQIEPYEDSDKGVQMMRVTVSRPVVRDGLVRRETILSQPSLAEVWTVNENFTELDIDQVNLLNGVLRGCTATVPPDPSWNEKSSGEDSGISDAQAALEPKGNSPTGFHQQTHADDSRTPKCPRCNSDLRASARYCDSCGTNLKKFEATTVIAAAENSVSSETSDFWIGRTVGVKYELLEKLGEGNIGVVYKARRNDIALEVAIKLLHSKHSTDSKFVERFKREAEAASRIRHSNVVAIYDFSEGDATSPAFIAMELISGDSLDTILRKHGRFTPERAISLMREICKGVGAGHKLGIVHRDLKPANIMIVKSDDEDEQERIKVLDFGLAKLLDLDGGNALTEVGTVMGTPFYMSPEQCLGEQLDLRSDVYSLGIMLYEMVAGNRPFEGIDFGAIKRQHLNTVASPLPADLGLEPELVATIMRSLSKEREKRQEDAHVFGRDLKKVGAASLVEAGKTHIRRPFMEDGASALKQLVADDAQRDSFDRVAETLAEGIRFKKKRETWRRSEVAREDAKREVVALFDELLTRGKRITDQGIEIQSATNTEACTLRCRGLLLLASWNPGRFVNSLEGTGLTMELRSNTKPFNMINQYGNEARTLRTDRYDIDMAADSSIGWREREGSKQVLSSAKIADIWLAVFLKEIDRELAAE